MTRILLPQLDHEEDLPVGMTHPVGAHCPFTNGGTHRIGSTCCSIDATAAVHALKRLGEDGLADLVQSDLDLTHVHGLGYFLRDIAINLAALHLQHRLSVERLPPVEREAASDDARKRGVEFLTWSVPEFEEVVVSIGHLAEWYIQLSELRFGARVQR